jgi:DNA invertase Pin-like site-specific DNA recombinase
LALIASLSRWSASDRIAQVTQAMDGGPEYGRDEKPRLVRGARYVRMSTEHQKYSTENQAAAIDHFAAQRGITIVRTYADEGKSGLSLDGRDALKRLIDDVQYGRTDFTTILVYDVSRWGRFQDTDESAYYEYICKRAGITVQYCTEQFENDGSLPATILKGLKRAMAGEYSRELSTKVFRGQCRLIELGFRQGGAPGFGLRRQLIDEHRNPKGQLAHGEYKSLQTDRVILVPGPPSEVETVRRIYRLFVVRRRSEREIAGQLNDEGSTTDYGRPWTRGTVHQVLTNEKYIGNNVYNRVSFKLKQKRVVNRPDTWVRADGAFDGIVDLDFFQAARRIIDERSRRFSDAELLERLSRLLAEQGCLSGLAIDETDDMPSSSAYRSRFGSLIRAYHLIGYTPDRDYRYIQINRILRGLHPQVVADTIGGIERLGGLVQRDPITDLLTVNDEILVSIVISRCLTTIAGAFRWKIRFDAGLRPDITIAARMDPTNLRIHDYYLLPRVDVPATQLRLAEDNGVFLDAYRFDSLDFFFRLASRTNFRAAA